MDSIPQTGTASCWAGWMANEEISLVRKLNAFPALVKRKKANSNGTLALS